MHKRKEVIWLWITIPSRNAFFRSHQYCRPSLLCTHILCITFDQISIFLMDKNSLSYGILLKYNHLGLHFFLSLSLKIKRFPSFSRTTFLNSPSFFHTFFLSHLLLFSFHSLLSNNRKTLYCECENVCAGQCMCYVLWWITFNRNVGNVCCKNMTP